MSSPSLNKELVALALKCGAFQNEGGHGIPAGTLITFEPDELAAFVAALPSALPVEGAGTDLQYREALHCLSSVMRAASHALVSMAPSEKEAKLRSVLAKAHDWYMAEVNSPTYMGEPAIVGTPSKEGAAQVEVELKNDGVVHWVGNGSPRGVSRVGIPCREAGSIPAAITPHASPSEWGPTDKQIDELISAHWKGYLIHPDVERRREFARAVLSLSPSRGEAVDAARLDWMDANPGNVKHSRGYLGSPDSWAYVASHGGHEDKPTIREAIDAAMVQSKGGAT